MCLQSWLPRLSAQASNGVRPPRHQASVTYAPADEPLPANLYDLGILDGRGATTIGNPAGLGAGGESFFPGFIGASSEEFSQVSLFSLMNPPNGSTGTPFLIRPTS